MRAYRNDIKRIMKQLMLDYETKIAYRKDHTLEHIGIVELKILQSVENEALTQREILDMIPLKRTKVLALLKKMVDLNYLEKVVNENDKRSSYLQLGNQGLSLLSEYGKHEGLFLDFILKDMTINEEKAIVKFLSKIQQTEYMK